jgi:hypothetical protein
MGRLSKYGGSTGSTLTVSLTEECTINERDYGGYSTVEISGIKNVTKRIETITTTEATMITIGAGIAGGTYVAASIAYLRFTNIDDTNFIILTFANENDDEFAVKLDAGKSFILTSDNSGGMVDIIDAIDGTGLTYSLGDLKSITADADTASCDMEIYIACTA